MTQTLEERKAEAWTAWNEADEAWNEAEEARNETYKTWVDAEEAYRAILKEIAEEERK